METRREPWAACYDLYLMLLFAIARKVEIARRLRSGALSLVPGMLETEGPSLVDRLKKDGTLTPEAYALVKIQRRGPPGQESLTFPSYMDRWKAKIDRAYEVP